MTPEAIHAFLEKEKTTTLVKVEFKKRNTMRGRFIKANDYDDLRVKNFWRIVTEANLPAWEVKQDNNLLRLYSGSDFTRLTAISETATAKAAK